MCSAALFARDETRATTTVYADQCTALAVAAQLAHAPAFVVFNRLLVLDDVLKKDGHCTRLLTWLDSFELGEVVNCRDAEFRVASTVCRHRASNANVRKLRWSADLVG
jgi:hypothetical protein